MFLVQELLNTNKYDFVLWMDSDTVFTNFQPDLANILQSYESHIYCSTDFGDHYTICAGVFAFRNSKIGKHAIKMITDYYNSKPFQQMCIQNERNKLNGKWAQTCYEQGVMNNILYKYFKPYLTILDSSIIQNDIECHAKFILHYFDMSSEERETCFVKFSTPKQN
jgi:lipopolysaccharide biosynthesis glycosyltransferase